MYLMACVFEDFGDREEIRVGIFHHPEAFRGSGGLLFASRETLRLWSEGFDKEVRPLKATVTVGREEGQSAGRREFPRRSGTPKTSWFYHGVVPA